MVLLLSLLRVTTVVTLSVISYFHVSLVHLSFRLNKMMVNTNRKELLVRLLRVTTVVTCQLSRYKMIGKDL